MRFKILADDFDCDELRSTYCRDMVYTLRPGNETLEKYLDQWLKNGVAVVVTENAILTGKGE